MRKIQISLSKILIYAYIVLSAVFIAYSFWTWIQNSIVHHAFQAGRIETVKQILHEAQKENCQAFPIFYEDYSVELINTQCLKTQETAS